MKRLVKYKKFFEKYLDDENIWIIDIETIKETLYDLNDEGVTTNVVKIFTDKYDNIIQLNEVEIDDRYKPAVLIEIKSNDKDDKLIERSIEQIKSISRKFEILTMDNFYNKYKHYVKFDLIIRQKNEIFFDIKKVFKYYEIDADFNENNEAFIIWDHNQLLNAVASKINDLVMPKKLFNAILNNDIDVYHNYYKKYDSLIEDNSLYKIISSENKDIISAKLNSEDKNVFFNSEIFNKVKEIYETIFRADLANANFEIDSNRLYNKIIDVFKEEDFDIKEIRVDELGNTGFKITSNGIKNYFNDSNDKNFETFEDIVEAWILEFFEMDFEPYEEDWIEVDDYDFNSELNDYLKSL